MQDDGDTDLLVGWTKIKAAEVDFCAFPDKIDFDVEVPRLTRKDYEIKIQALSRPDPVDLTAECRLYIMTMPHLRTYQIPLFQFLPRALGPQYARSVRL